MSRVEEIKTAIQRLSADERKELIAEIPALLPELDGDAAWERLILDPRPRLALSELLDRAEAAGSPNDYPASVTRFARSL